LVYILAISYYSINSGKIFEQISKFQEESKLFPDFYEQTNNIVINLPDKKDLMTGEKAQLLIESLKQLMQTEKLFKNENLKIEDLSRELKLHSKYISYAINRIEGKNFFDFVNDYRIQEFNFEVLKMENKKLTYLSIAFDCGFGSKSAFNRAYKSAMGISPSEYIKIQKTLSQ